MRAIREGSATRLLAIAALVFTALACAGIHWVITIIALFLVAALASQYPALVIAGVVASIPVQSSFALPFVRGELTLTQLVLVGLVLGWGALIWRRRIWVDAVVVGFLLVMAAYVVSFTAVDEPELWFQETYRWAAAGVFYVISRSVMTSWQDIRPSLWAMLIGVAGVSVASLVQLVSESAPGDFVVGGAVRVYATFGTPNTLAAYLEMTVPIFLACIPLAWWKSGSARFIKIEKWGLVIVSGLGLIVIGLTQSRGGWVGIALGCLVLWWQLSNKVKVITLVATVIVVGGFLLTAPGQSQLKRFGDLREETTPIENVESRSSYEVGAGRGALWATAIAMIKDKPLTGVGAGEFDENYREYVPSWIDRFPRGQAHNVWLQMGAQAGIWGIVAYTAWFSASLWGIITARRRVDSDLTYWMITGILAVFVAYTVHSLVDYLNVLSLGLQLSAITAIALNLAPEPLSRYATKPVSDRSDAPLEPVTCPH